VIRDLRRGRDLDSVELSHLDGRVLHPVAHGVTADERRRHREELIAWLVGSGIPLVTDKGLSL
jgi:hypothetical protein